MLQFNSLVATYQMYQKPTGKQCFIIKNTVYSPEKKFTLYLEYNLSMLEKHSWETMFPNFFILWKHDQETMFSVCSPLETWLGNSVSWFVHLPETWLGNNVSWFVHLQETWPGNNVFMKHD